jgi:hypothetical protein
MAAKPKYSSLFRNLLDDPSLSCDAKKAVEISRRRTVASSE